MVKRKSAAARTRAALAKARRAERDGLSTIKDAQTMIAHLEGKLDGARKQELALEKEIERLRMDLAYEKHTREKEHADRCYLQSQTRGVLEAREYGIPSPDRERRERLMAFLLDRIFTGSGWPRLGDGRIERFLPITSADLRYVTDELAGVPIHRREAYERTLALLAAFYAAHNVGDAKPPERVHGVDLAARARFDALDAKQPTQVSAEPGKVSK